MPKKKPIRLVGVGMVALSVVMTSVQPAHSGILSRLRQSIRTLWSQRAEKRSEARGAYRQASALKAQGAAVYDQLEDTQRLLLQANDIYKDYYGQLKDTEGKIVQTRQRIKVATARYNEHKRLFGQRLSSIQRTGKLGYLDLIFGTRTLSDLTRRIYVLNALTNRDADLQSAMRADREELVAARNTFEAQWSERNRLARAASQERIRIALAEASQERLLNRINSSQEASLAYASAQEASSEELGNMINELSARRSVLARQYDDEHPHRPSRARVRYASNWSRELRPMPIREVTYHDSLEPEHGDAGHLRDSFSEELGHSDGDSSWGMPVRGRLSSRYGMRFHPILHRYKLHTGDDLAAGYGAPIRAAHGGRVLWSGWKKAYGNTVIVDLGNGVTTLYGHASKLSVRAGQPIRRGEVIGNVGSTGWSTGPHLHFEVRKNGKPVDPTSYLRGH